MLVGAQNNILDLNRVWNNYQWKTWKDLGTSFQVWNVHRSECWIWEISALLQTTRNWKICLFEEIIEEQNLHWWNLLSEANTRGGRGSSLAKRNSRKYQEQGAWVWLWNCSAINLNLWIFSFRNKASLTTEYLFSLFSNVAQILVKDYISNWRHKYKLLPTWESRTGVCDVWVRMQCWSCSWSRQ